MATRPPRPEGIAWITPYLIVKDANKAIEFYQKAFGFEKAFAMPGEDGKIMHAKLAWQDATIMLGPENPACSKSVAPATSGTPTPVSLYVYVPDVDALFKRATAAGAKVKMEPQDAFWGDRIAGLIDPDGHEWCFATNVGEWDPSKGCGSAT